MHRSSTFERSAPISITFLCAENLHLRIAYIYTTFSILMVKNSSHHLETVISVLPRVMSINLSSYSRRLHLSIQIFLDPSLILMAWTSCPLPPSNSKLQRITCSHFLRCRPFPIILILCPLPSIDLYEDTLNGEVSSIVPEISKTIHRGSTTSQASRSDLTPSYVKFIIL